MRTEDGTQPAHEGAARGLQARAVVADLHPERGLHLRLVGGDRGHAPKGEQPVPRIDGHGNPPPSRERDGRAHQAGGEEAEAVVAHQHAVDSAAKRAEGEPPGRGPRSVP